MSEWFQESGFWDVMAPALFDQRRWESTAAEVDGFVALLGIEPGAHVLDLCCGPGRHSLELARRGFTATGVDLHAPYLEQARAKNPDVEWVHSDMRAFVREGAFDAAINLFSSFGYFLDQDDDRRVAAQVRASLRPGGAFLIETASKEVLAAKFQPRAWYPLEDGSILLEERRIHDGWDRVRSTWTRIHGREQHSFGMDLRLYGGTELAALLRGADFADVRLFGGFDGRPYDHEAQRLVAVARV